MAIDIRISVGFLDNPKVVKLQRRYGANAVLCLIRLWLYAAVNKPTGILDGLDAEDIEIACGEHTASMHDALLELGFIHKTKNGYTIHDWEENQSWLCKSPERKEKAKAAAEKRWKPEKKQSVKRDAGSMLCAYDEHASGNAPFLSFPFLTLPTKLSNSKEFAMAWVEWETARKQQKKKLTEIAAKKQIEFLSSLQTVEEAIGSINQSIKNGYQGLFPEKSLSQQQPPAPTKLSHQVFKEYKIPTGEGEA